VKNLTVIGLFLGMLQLPSIAFAQSPPVAESLNYPSAYLTAFQGNPTTLTKAIDAIQRSTGGKVIEIRFIAPNGKSGYHAIVAKQAKITYARFEPPFKDVTQLEKVPDNVLSWRPQTEVSLATAAPVSLSQAIQTAETAQGGAAIAAGMARQAATSGIHAYNIMVDDRGSLRRIAVDSTTGRVIADLSGFEQWPNW
jgi:uncharacterized membrane protein YkoI